MPKRTSGKRSTDKEAASERVEETARAAKSKAVLDEEERVRNQEALDAKAGVVAKDFGYPGKILPEVTRPANAMPLLKTDTREKLLYKIACAGTPLGDEFFKQFPDRQEILELALSISVRLCVVAICNGELAPTQRIACMRLVAALNGKQLPAEEEPSSRPAPPFSIPTGMGDVNQTLDKIRKLTQ